MCVRSSFLFFLLNCINMHPVRITRFHWKQNVYGNYWKLSQNGCGECVLSSFFRLLLVCYHFEAVDRSNCVNMWTLIRYNLCLYPNRFLQRILTFRTGTLSLCMTKKMQINIHRKSNITAHQPSTIKIFIFPYNLYLFMAMLSHTRSQSASHSKLFAFIVSKWIFPFSQ